MSLLEITNLLNTSLQLQLQYSKTHLENWTVLYSEAEGSIYSLTPQDQLIPLIVALCKEGPVKATETEESEESKASIRQQAWQSLLLGLSDQLPEPTLNLSQAQRLLCFYPVTEALHRELLSAFEPILEAHFLCQFDDHAYWLLPSDGALNETLTAISQSIETEYDNNIRLCLSQKLNWAQGAKDLSIAYKTLKAIEALQADGEAVSPGIFEDYTLLLLIHEWLSKDQGPIETLLRLQHDFSQLDEETKKTIDMLFRMNLNLTDTAKALFIHRNTLIYRIDKFEKAYGMDLRVFEDAFKLKLLLLLK